ncbi:MAG TPA: hypothetical protein VF595_05925 [Tepidisphaeraceae bacterium]|jgi:hypothetical protein
MKFVGPIDLSKFELQNARIQNLAAAPSSPVVGQPYFDTSTSPGRFRVYDGTNWWNNATHLNGVLASAVAAVSTIPISDGSGKLNAGWISGVLDASGLTNGVTGTGSTVLSITPTLQAPFIDQFENAIHSHTSAGSGGTLTIDAIEDFYSAVTSLRLNQFEDPISALNLNNQRISNLGYPSSDSDAATKEYVDAHALGLDIKESVRVASIGNVVGSYDPEDGETSSGLLSGMPNTIDGITVAVGDRVLLKNQTAAAQNGIWKVGAVGSGNNGVWSRAKDFASSNQVSANGVSSGAFCFVEEGNTNADAGFVLTTNNPFDIGTATGSSLSFSQFSGAGSISAGNGLTKSGNVLSAVGTTNRVSVTGVGIDIDANYVGQTSITTLGTVNAGTWNANTIAVAKGGTGATDAAGAKANLGFLTKFSQDVGDGSATSIVVTHNLNTRDISNVAVIEKNSPYENVGITWKATSVNTITLEFGSAPTAAQYRCTITG